MMLPYINYYSFCSLLLRLISNARWISDEKVQIQIGRLVGVFRQKQYIKDKIITPSLKNISENKILKWTESFGWDNTKKELWKPYFHCGPLGKEISFYRKSTEEKF